MPKDINYIFLKEDSKMAPALARSGSGSGFGSVRIGLRLGPDAAPALARSGSGSGFGSKVIIFTQSQL